MPRIEATMALVPPGSKRNALAQKLHQLNAAAQTNDAAASAPDIEHVLPLPGERNLFPSHRIEGWHREGGVPAWAQLLAAGTILGVLLARGE